MPARSLICRSAAGLLLAGSLVAGPDKAPVGEPMTPEPPINLWDVTFRPYGWLAGIDGTVGVDGFTSGIDVPFESILDHLDMVAALQLDVRRDR